MRKQSAPILIDTFNDEVVEDIIKDLIDNKIERVFLCGLGEFYSSESFHNEKIEKCARYMPYLRDAGIEACIWINGFGHGLADITMYDEKGTYQGFVGEGGQTPADCYCPSDKRMQRDYCEFVKKIAAVNPSILMIDDDFRLGQRSYALGCFCPNHMADISARLGEKITREELVKLAFSGGANRYRDAYAASMSDTLVDFAKTLRRTVDSVNPEIRLGIAMCFDVWDSEGTDAFEIATALAGNTKPFLRTNGAPYWQTMTPWGDIISCIEYHKMQSAWCRESGLEIFSEGDVYPRPRYIIPANHLEIFDLALVANGGFDYILKYMYDYNHPFGYEDGYTKHHKKNESNREALAEIFDGKEPVGVRVFESMHKFHESDFGECHEGFEREILYSVFSRAQYPLSHNAIPTTYYGGDGAVAAFGENARHVPPELIKRGIVTDAVGAKILTDRGYDTGLISYEYKDYSCEKFLNGDSTRIDDVKTVKMTVSDKVLTDSRFTEDNSVASYRYQNKDGIKFFVLGYDSYRTPLHLICAYYMVDYNRQAQLIDAIEWIDGKPMVAKCLKNPFLYMTAARSEDSSLSLGLFNVYSDSIYDAKIELAEEFREVKFVNCNGKLSRGVLKLSGEIPPFGFAAVELVK